MGTKSYTFEITIIEGNDEFWEEINEKGITGCDEVKESIETCLQTQGYYAGDNCSVILKKFEDTL